MNVTTETVEVRLLTPDEGKWLNKGDVYSRTVYLGVEDQPENWTEVDESEVPEDFLATALPPEEPTPEEEPLEPPVS